MPRAALLGDLDVDVCVVGGGYSGLWSARELLARDPHLRVAVLEQAVCGFGASGRNGGWASALYPLEDEAVVERHGTEALHRLRGALQRAVVELGEVAKADGIDADYLRGGSLVVARSESQAVRLRADVDRARATGVPAADLAWLEPEEVRDRVRMSASRGATYTPHCARIHPAKLVRGLAAAVESRGVRIYEGTPVRRIEGARRGRRARAVTAHGTVTADVVVRATEGYTPRLPRERRTMVPLHSLMIATAPLSAAQWDLVGLRGGETFADGRHLIIYGQRTADGRLAFGGRGALYHFGSTVEDSHSDSPRIHRRLESTLAELFEDVDLQVTHRWGGALAMPRDLEPTVSLDRDSGLASLGGYTGDGVVLSRVAAQALAELVTGEDGEHSTLAFVRPPARRWEVEPARYLGINAGLLLAQRADAAEARGRSAGRAGRVLARLLGG